jgi:sulfur carrier protein
VRVLINGDPAELPDGASVAAAVRAAGVDGEPRGVAVAVDGEVVPRARWEDTPVTDSARVEVLRAVQGG